MRQFFGRLPKRGLGSTLASMNDPHVAALNYRICRNESVDYGNAEPLAHEEDGFRLRVKDETARFEMKEHCATEQEARDVVDPFIRNWEFDACFTHRHDHFHLDFDKSEIIDRDPAKGHVSLSAHARLGRPTATVRLTMRHSRYPPPPIGIDSSHPDVQTLYERYRRFREGGEDLPSFAYFCLTVLEYPFTPPKKGKRERAAASYGIDVEVLQSIGELSSTKGGSGARKREGVETPLTDHDHRFLERATVRLIRRLAEHHAAKGSLPTISMMDFS